MRPKIGLKKVTKKSRSKGLLWYNFRPHFSALRLGLFYDDKNWVVKNSEFREDQFFFKKKWCVRCLSWRLSFTCRVFASSDVRGLYGSPSSNDLGHVSIGESRRVDLRVLQRDRMAASKIDEKLIYASKNVLRLRIKLVWDWRAAVWAEYFYLFLAVFCLISLEFCKFSKETPQNRGGTSDKIGGR